MFSACDSIKVNQSFSIYIAGTYGLDEDCSSSSRVIINSEKINFGKTQCEVRNISMVEEEPGWQLSVNNCVSDLSSKPDKSEKIVKILVDDDNNTRIENWFKYEPVNIFKCEIK